VSDAYTTIRTESRVEIKVKGSRFIGETCLAGSVDEAMARLTAVRKRDYQATHHCYAYVTGWPDQAEFKYSDDGEPSGTAGRPIYDVITGNGLTNLLVIVTRYFGGTKLGTGGLVRAYGDAARAAVEASGRQEQFLTRDYRFVLEFARYDQWLREMDRLGATVVASEFTDEVTLRIRVRRSLAESLMAAFVELTSGKGEVEEIDAPE
jgi:uncharacterized YigZ family protein